MKRSSWVWAVRTAAVFLFALISVGALHASILVLANGDRLTGHVIKRKHGKIYFRSDALGEIVVPAAGVSIVELPASANPVNSLTGVPPQPPAPPTVKVAAKPAGQPAVVTLPRAPWKGQIEFGYDNLVSNDVRTVNTTLRASTERTVGPDNFLFKGSMIYAYSAGVASADQHDAEFRWRHDLSDQFFGQSDNTYDSDQIRLIRYNIEENEDIGYKLFKNLRQTVDVGLGATGQELDAEGVEQGFNYLGNVFQDFTYKINGRYTLSEDFSARYSPEERERYGFVGSTSVPLNGLERDYDYRFHSTLQGKISKHLSLNLHFEYDFDNAILDPDARGSQRVTTTLGYGF